LVKRSSHRIGLADELMLRIFRGDYPAGSDLPAERQLAVDLGVDRTTLRMTLKQLQRMGLLVPRHGSGIRVVDWRDGGVDVLAAMFTLPGLPLEGSFIVEALDFWIETLSTMVAKAAVRMSLDEMRAIERLLDRAIEKSPDEVVESVMAVQDLIANLSGSVFFRMLSNSTRSVRARICRLLVETDDANAGIVELRRLLRAAAVNRPAEDAARRIVLEALRAFTAPIRERLLFGGAATARAAPDSRPPRRGSSRGAPRRRWRRRARRDA
jgi:DNA-binding FadR family transcriptional regulator